MNLQLEEEKTFDEINEELRSALGEERHDGLFRMYFPVSGTPSSSWPYLLSHAICFFTMHQPLSPLEVAFGLRSELQPLKVGFRMRIYEPDPRKDAEETKQQMEIHTRFLRHRFHVERSENRDRWERAMEMKNRFTKKRIDYARSLGFEEEADQMEREIEDFRAWYRQSGFPEVYAGKAEPSHTFFVIESHFMRYFRERPSGPSFDMDMAFTRNKRLQLQTESLRKMNSYIGVNGKPMCPLSPKLFKHFARCEWEREMEMKNRFTKERIRYARSLGHEEKADQMEKEQKDFEVWYLQSGIPEVLTGEEEPNLAFDFVTRVFLNYFRERPSGPSFEDDMKEGSIVLLLYMLGMVPTYVPFDPESRSDFEISFPN